MSLQFAFFFAAAIIFGCYWGYKARDLSERDKDLHSFIPFNNKIVDYLFPILFCGLVTAGLLA
jgi:hypothetical protein